MLSITIIKGWHDIAKYYIYVYCISSISFIIKLSGALRSKCRPIAALCNLYGTCKCLRVQGFMIDPDFIGILKKIKLGCHDGNLGTFFYLHNS